MGQVNHRLMHGPGPGLALPPCTELIHFKWFAPHAESWGVIYIYAILLRPICLAFHSFHTCRSSPESQACIHGVDSECL